MRRFLNKELTMPRWAFLSLMLLVFLLVVIVCICPIVYSDNGRSLSLDYSIIMEQEQSILDEAICEKVGCLEFFEVDDIESSYWGQADGGLYWKNVTITIRGKADLEDILPQYEENSY